MRDFRTRLSKTFARHRFRLVLGLVSLAAAFSYGFLCNHYRLPPYGRIVPAARALKQSTFVRRVFAFIHGEPIDGRRFAEARASLASEEGLSELQQQQIAELRSLGYLSGTTPGRDQTGVTVNIAELTHAGLNLVIDGHSPKAVLMDMQGRVLHRWHYPFEAAFPNANVPFGTEGVKYWRRARMLENGDLLAIFEGNGLIKIDRDSRLIWAYPGTAHHDFEVLEDGTIYVLTREAEIVPFISDVDPILHDFITILDEHGRERRRISIPKAMANSVYATLLDRAEKHGDILHTNELEVLNGSLAKKLAAFKPGNVLVSVPGINGIAVIDIVREQVVWALSGLWISQHHPTVLENGHMMIFDNKGDNGRSRVVEFDPLTQEIVWSYDGSKFDFYTPTCGANQRLPNGDLPPFSSTTRKQKIHETWPSCNASTSKLSGC